jgi:hypothetical protein
MTDLVVSQQTINFHVTEATTQVIAFSLPETTLQLSCIGQRGLQGIPGVAGAAGAISGTTFAFNEVSPIAYVTIPANKLVLECRIVIETVFDGTGAALSIGTASNPQQLLSNLQNNPFEVGGYYTTPLVSFGSDTALNLYITPGIDASQGAGRFFILVEG